MYSIIPGRKPEFRFASVRVHMLAFVGLLMFVQQGRAEKITIQAPFWRLGGGFESTLMINNAQPREIEAEVLVYGPMGRRIPAKPIHLPPLASVDLSLGGLVGIGGGYGSIALRYEGKPLEIAAQIVITHAKRGWTFNEGLLPKNPNADRRIEGVTYLGPLSRETHLAISSTSDKVREISLLARTALSERATKFRLVAHQTILLSLADLVSGRGGAADRLDAERRLGTLAISVEHDGEGGDILVHGLVVSELGLSANMRFGRPSNLQSNRLITPVLRPAPDHRPLLALNNLAQVDLKIVPEVFYRVGETVATQALPEIPVPAAKVIGLDMSTLLAGLPPGSRDIGLSLEYEGPVGSLLADLVVVNPATHAVIQATPKDTGGEGAVGMSFGFRLDGDANTVIAVANPSSTEEVMMCVFLLFDGKTYTYNETKFLAPGEVRHVDIKRLRDEQIPGDDDDTLPRDLVSGQAKLQVHNDPGQHFKLVGQSIQTGSDGKDLGFLSCPVCPPDPYYVSLTPLSFTGNIGTNQQITPRIHWTDGTSKINNNPFAIDWYPANTSIATVSEAWSNFRVQFQNPGATTIEAEMPNECHYEVDEYFNCYCHSALPVWTLAAAQVATKPTVQITSGSLKVPLANVSGVTKSIQRTASGNPGGGTYSWSTSSQRISLSNATMATVTVTSVSQSSSQNDVPLTVTYTVNGQSNTSTVNLTVVKPNSLTASSLPTGSHSCTQPSGCVSYQTLRLYIMKDQFGNTFGPWPQIKLREAFSNFSSNCAGVSSPPTPTNQTFSNFSNFEDEFWLCSNSCSYCTQGAPGCQGNASQKWYVNEFEVGTYNITWTCNGATIVP